jgi:APA family basic amino acid/polyamine antiporter
VLGVPALFSAGYGNVGSSIYYALGVVALVAIGATPIALVIAGILFIFTALTYAEGTAMIPEAGGSASFARRGFNDLVGFVSGWALMLSYIVTIAISAYIISPYLGYFWAPLKESPVAGTAVSMGIILFLMFINVTGVKESSRVNILFTVIDLATQVSIIVLGIWLILAVNPANLFQNMFGEGNWPTTPNLLFGIALAALAFTGVETVSQMAEETHRPQVRAPRALMMMIVTVLVLFIGISIVALSAMTPQELAQDWARDPIAGIAANLPSGTLESIYMPLVAGLAATILLIATNAGVMGISRLAFSMGVHRQMPLALSRVHERFRTPHFSIIIFCLIALAMLIPGFFTAGFFEDLGALYTFGSLLSFAFAHASILVLRVREPKLPRPFKIGLNINIKGRDIPITAVMGLVATLGIWLVIITVQRYSLMVGFGWMIFGLLAYYIYRRRAHLPLTRVKESEQVD